MAGAYCKYCDRRCFVLRTLPDDATQDAGRSMHLATCSSGANYDRLITGYDHSTAINPLADQTPSNDPADWTIVRRDSRVAGTEDGDPR